MAGDWTGYKSESGRLALCSLLAYFTNYNRTQTERIFGGSPLAERAKWWDRPDYRQATITKAFQNCPHLPRQRSFETSGPAQDRDADPTDEQKRRHIKSQKTLRERSRCQTDEVMLCSLAGSWRLPGGAGQRLRAAIVTLRRSQEKTQRTAWSPSSRCWRTVMLAEEKTLWSGRSTWLANTPT